MVCIAAFIILAIIGVFVAVISIFKPKVGKSYWRMFKKAWSCLWKKVRLQKCETGFKEDVKNTILSRIIVKHPKWAKPLSVAIEIASVIIVVVATWAILTAIKSLLALWVFGSCNVTRPSSCSLGGEICSIDETEPTNLIESTGRWFEEWGEIFEAIPDKFSTYDASEYDFNYITVLGPNAENPLAIDIFDPGCTVCMISYRNQKAAGFFEKYNVRLVPFAIQDSEDNYKFNNSEIIVRYMFAAEQIESGLAIKLLDHIFMEKNEDGLSYQTLFNEYYSKGEAQAQLEAWLEMAGIMPDGMAEIRAIAYYPETSTKMSENRSLIEDSLHIKGIPTMIYDGKKHTGIWSN